MKNKPDEEIKRLLDKKASNVHTHTMSDIQGIESGMDSMITDYLSGYARVCHEHTIGNIQGLSDEINSLERGLNSLESGLNSLESGLNNKSAIGHKHDVADINNIQNVIDSQLPNLSGYATTHELTSGLNSKQNTLTAGQNITI